LKQTHTVRVVTLVRVTAEGADASEVVDKVAECMENMDYNFDSTTEAEIVSTEIVESDTINIKEA
jgi:hypothetical protein